MIVFCTAPWLCHSSKTLQVLCKQQLSLWTPAMLHYLLFIDKEALSPEKGVCQGHRNNESAEKGSTALAAQSSSTFCIATDASPRNTREVLVAHSPGGSLSLCPLVSLLSLLTTVSLNSDFSKVKWWPSKELETACFSLHTQNLSQFLGSHAQFNRGSEQSKVQELCFRSILGIAHLLCCQKARNPREKKHKKYGCEGKGSERESDCKWYATFRRYH